VFTVLLLFRTVGDPPSSAAVPLSERTSLTPVPVSVNTVATAAPSSGEIYIQLFCLCMKVAGMCAVPCDGSKPLRNLRLCSVMLVHPIARFAHDDVALRSSVLSLLFVQVFEIP
jgi:hypothetical protein